MERAGSEVSPVTQSGRARRRGRPRRLSDGAAAGTARLPPAVPCPRSAVMTTPPDPHHSVELQGLSESSSPSQRVPPEASSLGINDSRCRICRKLIWR